MLNILFGIILPLFIIVVCSASLGYLAVLAVAWLWFYSVEFYKCVLRGSVKKFKGRVLKYL